MNVGSEAAQMGNAVEFLQAKLSECASLLALFTKFLKIGLFLKAAASCRTPKAPSGRNNYAALGADMPGFAAIEEAS
jgi:hypothetical protein